MKKAFLLVVFASLFLFVLASFTGCAGGGGGSDPQSSNQDNPPDNSDNPPDDSDNPPDDTDNPPDDSDNPPDDSDNPPPPSIDVVINQIEIDCQTADVTELTSYVTVIDQDGIQITTLGAADFSVTVDSVPVDTADLDVSFVEQVQNPISVAVVMDYSKSITDAPTDQAKMEAAVSGFVDLLGTQDEAEIIKFGKLVKVMQAFTSNKSLLKAAVAADPDAGGWTYLYEALDQAVTDAAARTQRKAVVALTDGREWIENGTDDQGKPIDQSNPDGLADLIAHAKQTGVPVFLISLGTDIDFDALEQIASESGGHLYRASDSSELAQIYADVSDALTLNQYLLRLELPSTGGGTAELTVEVTHNDLTDSFSKQFDLCP